jgi:hypothetical protein
LVPTVLVLGLKVQTAPVVLVMVVMEAVLDV